MTRNSISFLELLSQKYDHDSTEMFSGALEVCAAL